PGGSKGRAAGPLPQRPGSRPFWGGGAVGRPAWGRRIKTAGLLAAGVPRRCRVAPFGNTQGGYALTPGTRESSLIQGRGDRRTRRTRNGTPQKRGGAPASGTRRLIDTRGTASGRRRVRTTELHRGRAGDGSRDVRLVVDVELHRPLEGERAIHGGTGADGDRRDVVAGEMDAEDAVVLRLHHLDAAIHHGVAGDVDVAIDGGDALADVRAVDRDVAVDVGELAVHRRTGGEIKLAVHRRDITGHRGVLVQAHAAV